MSEPDIIVIKVGGSVLSDDSSASRLVESLCTRMAAGRTVLIHGGGSDITSWLDRLGITPGFIEGQRVTCPYTMKVVEMVLSGLMNKKLVRLLEEKGYPAAGISGRDGSLASAGFLDKRLGRVGVVEKVDPGILLSLMNSGFIPVVSPVSSGPDGGPLNVNADFFASRIAAALSAAELNLVTASGGVLSGEVLIEKLSCDRIPGLISDGIATAGMIPKLQSALSAREEGVKRVNILNYEGRVGTCVE